MILDVIFSLGYILLSLVIQILPESTGFPAEVNTAVTSLGGYVGILDPIFPISTLATVVGLVFSTELAIFMFKNSKWIIGHIPWVGGKGN